VLGKGNKERTVYIDEVTAMVLTEYFDTRTDDSPALFRGIRSNSARLSPHGVREMLVKLGERSGVENVHPHRFRRTLATMLILHGMPIQEVAALLGHEKIDTTMAYVNISREDIKHDYKRLT
jgi:site-specific recombinase XerD